MLPEPGPEPDLTECPAPGCRNTEDLHVMECAPGYTWVFTSTVCGHVAFIYWKETG